MHQVNDNALRVAFRADASESIGLGHLKRCVSLATALRRLGARVGFVTRDLGLSVETFLEGMEHWSLPSPGQTATTPHAFPFDAWLGVEWSVDAEQTQDALSNWRPHWVVVDHYGVDGRWHRRVTTALSGSRIAAIDDLADRDLDVDLLIDHNFHADHADKYANRLRRPCQILGGPKFALLGPSFSAAHGKYAFREQVESVGIFMGGSDAANLATTMLRACREYAGFVGDIEVVSTSVAPHLAEVRALAARWERTAVLTDLPDLAEFFGRHDLQIGAGGGATWERCCLGAPALVALAAPNQNSIIPAIERLGIAELLDVDLHDIAAVGRKIRWLIENPQRRRELSEASHALVDGLGAHRVALRMAASTLYVRRAALIDAQFMYEWRNHPATRSVSRSQDEIDWAQHRDWVLRSLHNTDRCLLIGSVGTVVVGVIRFDAQQNHIWEVSLYLNPSLHGLGLGRALLRAGELYLCAHYVGVREIIAAVLQGNDSSTRMFAASGYRLVGDIWRKPCAVLARS